MKKSRTISHYAMRKRNMWKIHIKTRTEAELKVALKETPYSALDQPNPQIQYSKSRQRHLKGNIRSLHGNSLLPRGYLESYITVQNYKKRYQNLNQERGLEIGSGISKTEFDKWICPNTITYMQWRSYLGC